ncbi:MAG: hypothetical protein J6C37_09230 [Roseburia sp.]|nr:hypothetical protein [Roseburia sp.]
MRKKRKVLAVLMLLVMLLQVAPVNAAGTDGGESSENEKLYVFELESFINSLPSSKLQYDYLKVATALQGLANREKPQLYYYFINGDEARINFNDTDVDEYWLEHLSADGEMLADYEQVTVTDFWELFELFGDCYDGIVLWDENVPATSNVASTIAGVENRLPVRYAIGEDDLYTVMKEKNVTKDNEKSLVDMFTGEGTIPDSDTVSTGSARTDAYIWAKEQYLDTGLTNPLLMTYSIDGGSWAYDDDGKERNAQFLQTALPTTMEPGEIVKFRLKVKNTGTLTWEKNNMYRLGMDTSDGFGLYLDAEGQSFITSAKDRLPLSLDVEADGECYIEGYLKAPETEGSYEISFSMIQDGVEWFGKKLYHTVYVQISDEEEPEEEEIPEITAPENDADIMLVGHYDADQMSIQVRNTGTNTWAIATTDTDGYFLKYTYGENVKYAKPTAETAQNSDAVFTLDLTDATDDVAVTMQMVHRADSEDTAFGDSYTTQSVEVTAEYDAKILSVGVPEYIAPNGKEEITVAVMNTGSATWNIGSAIRLGTTSRVMSKVGESDDDGRLLNRIELENTFNVEPGDVYLFHLDLHGEVSPDASTDGSLNTPLSGSQSVKFQMVKDSAPGAWFGESTAITPYVGYEAQMLSNITNTAVEKTINNENVTLKAEFISCELPSAMTTGEIVPFKLTVKNTGSQTWTKGSMYRLGVNNTEFKLCTDGDGTNSVSSGKNRLFLSQDVAVGEEYTFSGYLQAPTTAGATLTLDMIYDGVAWYGINYTPAVTVGEASTTTVATPENDAYILNNKKTENGLTIWVRNFGSAVWGPGSDSNNGYFVRWNVEDSTDYSYAPMVLNNVRNYAELTGLPTSGNIVLQIVKRTDGVDELLGDAYIYTLAEETAPLWGMEFLDTDIPASITPGETAEAIVIVKNTGTETWSPSKAVRLVLDKRVSSYLGTSDDVGKLGNRVQVDRAIEPGDVYLFHFDLHSRVTAEDATSTDLTGTVDVTLNMIAQETSSYAWFYESDGMTKKTHKISYNVGETVEIYEAALRDITCTEVDTNSDGYNAVFMQVGLPETMEAGSIVKVKFAIKNTGTTAISANGYLRLGFDGLSVYTDPVNLKNAYSSYCNRLTPTTAIASGETYTFEGYIKAPDQAGEYNLKVQMIYVGKYWFGSSYTQNINVTGFVDDGLVMKDVESSGVVYDNIWQTALANADYYIAEKAFFWDLSPDGTIAPIDDRTQPVGADLATLEDILLSQAQQAKKATEEGNGYGFYTVGGFVPWFLKYTNYADIQSAMGPVDAEWAMVEIISSFHGELDADAYGTISMSNGSVFYHGELEVDDTTGTMVQNNNKETIMATDSAEIEYDPDTAYIMFYMGDWDSAAWVNGILPFIWEESVQDAIDHPDDPIPLAWPINYILTNRVPHVYNMLYSTMTSSDYFVAGDNGSGYLNPMYLEGELMGEGITENYLDEWVAYNQYTYNLMDLDITGFLIEATLGDSTETVRQAYTQISPYGVIMNNTAHETIVTKDNEGNVISETPFPEMRDLDSMRTEALQQSSANTIAGNIKFDGQFFAYRSVKASRANIRATLELLEEQNPGIKYEVVDPYTFMKLYAAYGEDSSSTVGGAAYETSYATNTVTIDGTVGTAEWNDADVMTVNASAQEISDHGYVWGDIGDTSDLDVEYRMKWDEDNLYLLEKRTDNYIKYNYNVGSTPLYDIDASMLYLDLDGKQDGAKYFEGDFAIHYSVQSDGTVIAYLRTGSEDGTKNHTQLTVGTDVQICYQETEDGYVFELAIPWSLFANGDFSYTPDVNTVVGMTVLAIDHDESTSGGRQIMWHGNGDTQENWGTMKLAAGQQVSDQNVDEVISKIDAIGTVTLDSEKTIEIARKAYDALTDAQKEMVTNYEKLTIAEAKLAELKKSADMAEADKAAANAVISKIDAIGTVTLDSEKTIEIARKAYDALTDAQKKMVTNYEKLTLAEAKLAELKLAGDKATDDKATDVEADVVGTSDNNTDVKPSSPNTSDSTDLALPCGIMLLGMIGVAGVVIASKKKKATN